MTRDEKLDHITVVAEQSEVATILRSAAEDTQETRAEAAARYVRENMDTGKGPLAVLCEGDEHVVVQVEEPLRLLGVVRPGHPAKLNTFASAKVFEPEHAEFHRGHGPKLLRIRLGKLMAGPLLPPVGDPTLEETFEVDDLTSEETFAAIWAKLGPALGEVNREQLKLGLERARHYCLPTGKTYGLVKPDPDKGPDEGERALEFVVSDLDTSAA